MLLRRLKGVSGYSRVLSQVRYEETSSLLKSLLMARIADASDPPTLLCIDDIHLVDSASLEVCDAMRCDATHTCNATHDLHLSCDVRRAPAMLCIAAAPVISCGATRHARASPTDRLGPRSLETCAVCLQTLRTPAYS